MAYQFKYKLTPEEFAEYNVYTVWNAPWQKKTRTKFLLNNGFYILVMMIAGIVITEKLLSTRSGNYLIPVISIIILLVILMAFIYYHEPHRIRDKAKMLVLNDENAHILNETELEISENGIFNTDKDSAVQQKWGSVIRYANTKDFFYLYTNSIQAQIIPKRLFSTQKEIDEFDKYLTEKIPLASSFRSL